MKNRRNYYRVLQVQPDAPGEIIRASYRALMRELKQHPDLGGSTAAAALLNEAYETLSDPERRTSYDEKMRTRHFRRTAEAADFKDVRPLELQCPFCKTVLESSELGGNCPACRIPLSPCDRADLNKTSHRSIARVRKNGLIYYCSEPGGTPREAQIVDISPKGVRFNCAEELRPGTVLKITGADLTACGVVTNLQDAGRRRDSSYTVGISFLAVRFEDSRGSFISLSG